MSQTNLSGWKFEGGAEPKGKNLVWTDVVPSEYIEAKPPGGGSYRCFGSGSEENYGSKENYVIRLDEGGKRKVRFPEVNLKKMVYFEPGDLSGRQFEAKEWTHKRLEYRSVDDGSIFRFEYHEPFTEAENFGFVMLFLFILFVFGVLVYLAFCPYWEAQNNISSSADTLSSQTAEESVTRENFEKVVKCLNESLTGPKKDKEIENQIWKILIESEMPVKSMKGGLLQELIRHCSRNSLTAEHLNYVEEMYEEWQQKPTILQKKKKRAKIVTAVLVLLLVGALAGVSYWILSFKMWGSDSDK